MRPYTALRRGMPITCPPGRLRLLPVRVTSTSLRLTASNTATRRALHVVATYPTPETEKERSPIDFPQEWITPQPSRRPDIFPEFEKLETPLPKPLPGDPEQPDEEEEEEKIKKPPEKEPEKKEGEEEEEEPKKPGPEPSE